MEIGLSHANDNVQEAKSSPSDGIETSSVGANTEVRLKATKLWPDSELAGDFEDRGVEEVLVEPLISIDPRSSLDRRRKFILSRAL